MFERYTEKARRAIFFARYEASQLGSLTIDPEHLLLGLLREDQGLAAHFLKTEAAIEAIRGPLETRAGPGSSIARDIPLNHEAKRVLAYGAEESERMNHEYIGTPHLFLGLLRETRSALLLAGHGVTLERAREDVAGMVFDAPRHAPPASVTQAALPGSLMATLSHLETTADVTVALGPAVTGAGVVEAAVYEGRGVATDGIPLAAAGSAAELRSRLRSISRQLEAAIARHEFEAARHLSDAERRVRQELRQALPNGTADRIPFLCILLLLEDEGILALRGRIDALFRAGVGHVWMLHPAGRRVYTVTPAEGLREFKGEILRVEQPRLLEVEPRMLFD